MPRDPMPLTEQEQFTLRRLLDKRSQTLPEAQQERDRERDREARLQAKQAKLVAEEQKLSRRLAQLHVDIDCVSAELFRLAPSGVSFRFVNERLQQLNTLVPTQSFFNTRFDNLDQKQIQLLAEIGLATFEAATHPKGRKTLREKMAGIEVSVGQDAPDAGGPSDGRAALAAAIIAAGKKRRNES